MNPWLAPPSPIGRSDLDLTLAEAIAINPLRYIHRAVLQKQFLSNGRFFDVQTLDITTPAVYDRPLSPSEQPSQRSMLSPLPVAIIRKGSLSTSLTIKDDRGRVLSPLNRTLGLRLTGYLMALRIRALGIAPALEWQMWRERIEDVGASDRTVAERAYDDLCGRDGPFSQNRRVQEILAKALRISLLFVVLDDVSDWRRRVITVSYCREWPRPSRQVLPGLGLSSTYQIFRVPTSYARSHHFEITAPDGANISDVEPLDA